MDGEVVQTFPDRPLRPSDLRLLDNHDRMEILAAEGAMPSPVADSIVIQTESWYYGLSYDENRGWFVFNRLSRSSPDAREQIQAEFDERVDDDEPVRTDRPF